MDGEFLRLAVAFGLGYAIRWATTLPVRAMELRPARAVTVYESVHDIAIVDVHGARRTRWRMMTLRFVTLCETVAPGSAWLPGRVALGKATGETWRTWAPYLDVLERGGVVARRGSRGARWTTMRRAERRRMIAALPYPTGREPPEFDFAQRSVTA